MKEICEAQFLAIYADENSSHKECFSVFVMYFSQAVKIVKILGDYVTEAFKFSGDNGHAKEVFEG